MHIYMCENARTLHPLEVGPLKPIWFLKLSVKSIILSNNCKWKGCQTIWSDALAIFIFTLKKASASDQNVGKITNNQKVVPGESLLSHAWTSWEAPTSKLVQEKRKTGTGFIIWQRNFWHDKCACVLGFCKYSSTWCILFVWHHSLQIRT